VVVATTNRAVIEKTDRVMGFRDGWVVTSEMAG
jgi:hypothetical protein